MMKRAIVSILLVLIAGVSASAQGDLNAKLSSYYSVQNDGNDTSAFSLLKDIFVGIRESTNRDLDVLDKYIKASHDFLNFFVLCSPEDEEVKGLNTCARIEFEHGQINNVLLPESYSMRAEAKLIINDYLGAIEDYNTAIKYKNDVASYYTNRGNVRYKMKDADGALLDFDQSIAIDPTNPAVFYNKGMVLMKNKDYTNAALAFTQSLNLDRTNTKTMLYKAIAEYLYDNKEAATTTLNELLSLEPANSEAHYYNGMILYKNKDFAGAKTAFAKSVEADTTNDKSWYFLGISAFNLQDKTTACTSWNKALGLGYDKAQKLIDEHCKAE